MRQAKAIHRARHVNVGEYDPNVAAVFQDQNGLVRICSFNHLEPGFFDHCDGVQTYQCLVFDQQND
jgi:hypothetical protein